MDKILVEQLHNSQQVNSQLEEHVLALLAENELLKQQYQELQQQLSNVIAPNLPQPDYEAVRDRVLKSLTGKGKIGTFSPQYKFAAKALGAGEETVRQVTLRD